VSGIEVNGLDEVLKKLKKLPEKVQKRVLVGAVRAGAKPIIKEAKRLVPVRTGTLKKSIGVVKRRSKNKNLIHFTVTPRKKKGGWYAHYVEFGTLKMSARPFMRPAYEKEGENSIKFVREYMKKRVDKEIAKL